MENKPREKKLLSSSFLIILCGSARLVSKILGANKFALRKWFIMSF